MFGFYLLRLFCFFFFVANNAPSAEISSIHKYVNKTVDAFIPSPLLKKSEMIKIKSENMKPDKMPDKSPQFPLNLEPEYPHTNEHTTMHTYEKGRISFVGSEFLYAINDIMKRKMLRACCIKGPKIVPRVCSCCIMWH